jgi:2-oxoglutarate dehydrogenase E2 component (dihydrolipoamide succinyltransferase)
MRFSRVAASGLRAAAVAAAAGLALAGCSAAATPPPPPEAPGAAPAPAPVQDAPFGVVADTPDGRARLTLAPGGTAALAFRVANSAGAERAFALRAADVLGNGAVAPSGAAPRGAGAWLRPPAGVVVRPRESAAVAVAVRVPADAAPGAYEGALVASPSRAAAAPAGTGAAVAYEVAARVTVVVGR